VRVYVCLCIVPIVARQPLGKNPLIVTRQWLGKNPTIVARQLHGESPLFVARQRLGRNATIGRIVLRVVFNVARVVSRKVGDSFFPELIVFWGGGSVHIFLFGVEADPV
jgi:hypothetical protein